MDNALLVHAVKLRAIDHRRQLPRGGQVRRDALHFANYIDGKVATHRLGGLLDEDGDYLGEGDTDLQSAWLAATSADPADTLASAVDLHDWIGTLPPADRKLLEARFAGDTLSEIAASTDTSISRVFARLRRLGADLAARAGVSPVPSEPPRAARPCKPSRASDT
jgi:DNA-directed RNA polymerase specialized sigma24 family protein